MSSAALVPLGGGRFHIQDGPGSSGKKPNRRLTSSAILSDIISLLQPEGYAFSKPKHIKQEGVQTLYILEEGVGIDLYVSPREVDEKGCVFMIGGFGYVGKKHDWIAGESKIAEAWEKVKSASE